MGLAVIGVVAGIYHRHRSETHKRLMLLAMVSMLPPSISRWPIAVKRPAPVIVGIMLAFLAAAPISDLLSRPRQSLASLWGGLAVLLSLPLRFALAQTAAWHAFANWLVR